MGITWRELWNRYNFFSVSARHYDQEVKSITQPISQDDQAEYDINFQQALAKLGSDESIGGPDFGSLNYMNWLSMAETSKETRTQQYREMENNGFVSAGVDEIVYSSLNADEKGEQLYLKIKNEGFSENENIRENLVKEFNYIRDDVIGYAKNFATMFHEFIMMGECCLEFLIPQTDVQLRSLGILGTKLLLSEQYMPFYNPEGKVHGFVIRNPWDANVRVLGDRTQFAYVDSGKYDFVDGIGPAWAKQYLPNPSQGKVLRLVRSFLEEARKPYKQLDAIEDSIVIYRFSRAPGRLIFNVATGNLPKNRAEQYLQKIINKYRKKVTYNSTTGDIDQAQNTKNIMEDYWFVKDATGKGTEVTTLESGGNFGDIEDLNYFLAKLYRSMKIPMTRMTGEAGFDQSPQKNTEQIKFEKYIYGIVCRFVDLIKQTYMQHLKMKGVWDHYNMKPEDIEVEAVPPSFFTYMKNAEVLDAQFTRFANFSNNINTETPIFAKRTALKEGMGWSDEKIALNQKWLKEEAAEGQEEGGESEGGGETPEPSGGEEEGEEAGGGGGIEL